MDKTNLFDSIQVTPDISTQVLGMRYQEYRLRSVIWVLFVFPLWVLFLFVLVWNILHPSAEFSHVFYTVTLALMNIGAFSQKPKPLFQSSKGG